MPNTNCLDGIACPACGHEESFLVTCAIEIRLTDNGIDEDYAFKYGDGYEWDNTARIRCTKCDHTATVAAFTIPRQAAS